MVEDATFIEEHEEEGSEHEERSVEREGEEDQIRDGKSSVSICFRESGGVEEEEKERINRPAEVAAKREFKSLGELFWVTIIAERVDEVGL